MKYNKKEFSHYEKIPFYYRCREKSKGSARGFKCSTHQAL